MEVDKDVAKILYNLGESMIHDDKADIGWTTYSNRRLHYYGGRPAPSHTSPVHHWMAGTALCLIAQAMALVSTAQEASEVYQEIQQAITDEQAPESAFVEERSGS